MRTIDTRMAGALLAIALILGATWWKASHSGTASPPPRRAPAEGATASAHPSPPRAHVAPIPQPPPGGDPMDRQRTLERARAQSVIDAGRARLTSRFRAESPDPAWAAASERALMQSVSLPQMAAAGVRADNVAIECRRSICRIDADFPTRSAADDWAMLYLTGSGLRMANAVLDATPRPEGGVHLAIHGLVHR